MATAAIAVPPLSGRTPLYSSLFVQVLVALVLGIVLGVAAPDFAVSLKILSDAFLKLIQMIVAPIVFCVVVHGIAGAGDLKKVGRVGLKALVYFGVMTTVALAVGLVLAFLFAPGPRHEHHPATLDPKALSNYAANAKNLQGAGVGTFFLNIIPTTSIDALARNDVLQVLFFAILFGVALALVGEPAQQVTSLVEAVSKVLFKIMGLIVRVAPLGVLGAVAFTVGKYGVGSLKQLVPLVFIFYVCVVLFVVVVLGGVLRAVAGLNIFKFLGYFREELTIVLATASSDAVLPQIMRKLERIGVKEFRGRPRHSDRLLVQPRRFLDLSHARGGVYRSGDQYAAVARRSGAGAGGVAGDVQRRARHPGIGDRNFARDSQRGADRAGDRARSRPVGRLVHRHRPRSRQSDRQLRRHGRHRRRGARSRPADRRRVLDGEVQVDVTAG